MAAPIRKQDVDYSVYLVTDSSPGILGTVRDLCEDVVAPSVASGVTCVQYREKKADTNAMVAMGRRLHAVTRARGVPLLINDRVDVALAVGCEGVHIGQDDMDLAAARKLLGDDKIIGVTVSNLAELEAAVAGGADYLGIGTVFATPTKENTKSIIGIDGLQQLLIQMATLPNAASVRTVCIGGINARNAARVLWQSDVACPPRDQKHHPLDGLAVVSAIVASPDPAASARELRHLVETRPRPSFAPAPALASGLTTGTVQEGIVRTLLDRVPGVLRDIDARKPLSHNMTNLVVQNLAANVALCAGGSPIMANYGEEAVDLARLGGALVINMGTVTPDGLQNYLKALRAYNDAGRPVVFDPVGSGATAIRRGATKTILAGGYIDVLKGNQAEILSCANQISPPELSISPSSSAAASTTEQQQQRGVDSGPSTADPSKFAATLSNLATRRRNVVVATGKTDYLAAEGLGCVLAVDNGHEYLGMVTGTGCCLGTVISAALATAVASDRPSTIEDRVTAALAALLYYSIAAEIASARDDVRGPGTFVPAFLDELASIRRQTVNGDVGWLERARVSVIQC